MIVQIYKRKLIYEGMDDLIDKETSESVEVKWLIDTTIEILSEEDEEIDIQSIEEFEFGEIEDKNNYETRYKINELIKAVKKLDKKIKEEE